MTISMLVNAERKNVFPLANLSALHGLERARAEAAEEMDFDCPEFVPVERIKAGITEIVLAFLLLAGLAVFCGLHLVQH